MSSSIFKMVKYSNNSDIEDENISGTKSYDKFVLNHLKNKYNDLACFIIPKKTSKHDEHDYQILWEYETSKKTIVDDLESGIYDIYGERQLYVQNPSTYEKKGKNYGKDRFGTLYVHKMLDKKIELCLKGDKRFVVVMLNTYTSGAPHANVLIYDRKNKTLERFDPHGYNKASLPSYQSKVMDKDINSYFESKTTINEYIGPIDFCPKWKQWKSFGIAYQKIQGLEKFKNFKGSCATWVLWYIDLRLMNPDIPRETIIKKSINDINESSPSFTSFIIKVYNYYNRISNKVTNTRMKKTKRKSKKNKINSQVKTYVSKMLKSSN